MRYIVLSGGGVNGLFNAKCAADAKVLRGKIGIGFAKTGKHFKIPQKINAYIKPNFIAIHFNSPQTFK